MDFYENLFYSSVECADIELYCCGKRLNAPDHSFGPAARDYYWLIYLQEGSGCYTVDKTTFRIKKNTLFVAFPMSRIHYRADKGSVWSIRWVSLGSDTVREYLSAMNVTPENPIINVALPTAVENVMETLFNEIPKGTLQSKFNCISYVYSLLALLTEGGIESRSAESYIDDAIFYMIHNFDREISMEDVSGSVNLDRGYFSKLFRRKTGMTPSGWLYRYRMEKAASLLTGSGLKISEVGLSVGIADQFYFCRAFKKLYGMSPNKYRRTKA